VFTSWLLGNVYTAKSCKGEKRVPDTFKIGTGQLRETTPTENHPSSRIAGGGHGADNPTPENYIVQKLLGSQGQTERVVVL